MIAGHTACRVALSRCHGRGVLSCHSKKWVYSAKAHAHSVSDGAHGSLVVTSLMEQGLVIEPDEFPCLQTDAAGDPDMANLMTLYGIDRRRRRLERHPQGAHG